MAANKETQLNLKITAQDEARAVLREFSDEVRSTFESVRSVMSESFNAAALREGISSLGSEMRTSFEPVIGEIKALTNALNTLTEKFNTAGNAATKMGEKTAAAGKEAQTAGEKISKALSAHNLITAGTILEQVGHSMLGFFGDSVKAAADFDTNIHTVVASLDAMGDHSMKPEQAFEKMKEKALELGKSGFFSANQIAEAMNTMAAQGIDASHILGGAIQTVSDVAAANKQSLEHTAGVVSDIIHQMGDELKQEFGGNFKQQMEGVGNVLTKVLHNGRMSMEDFLSTMRYAGPQAASLGISFKDLAGSIAELARHGIRGTQAGTTLRRMFTNLIPTTAQQKEMFDKLGLTVHGTNNVFLDHYGKLKPLPQIQEELHKHISKLPPAMQEMALKTIFGQNALSGMTAIVNEAPDKFKALVKSMDDTKATSDALAEKKKSLGFQIQKVQAHFDTLKKEIGEMLAPIMLKLLGIVEKLFNAWDHLSPGVKQAIVTFGAIVGVIATVGGGILTFVGTLRMLWGALGPVISGVRMLFSLFSESLMAVLGPWGLVIAGVIAGVMLIVANWDKIVKWVKQNFGIQLPRNFKEFQTMVSQIWTQIVKWFEKSFNDIVKGFDQFGKSVENAWNGFKQWISDAAKAVVEFIVKCFEWLYNHNYYFQNLVDNIVNHWKVLSQATEQVWNAITSFISKTWNAISSKASAIWNAIVAYLTYVFNQIWSKVTSVWNNVSNKISSVWNSIKGYVHDGVTFIWNKLSDLANQAWNWGSNLMDMLVQGIESGVGKLTGAVKNVAGQIAKFLGFHSPTEEGPAADSDRWMPNMMRMFSDGINDNQSLVETAVENVAQGIKDRFHKAHRHVETLRASRFFEMLVNPHHIDASLGHLRNAYELMPGHTSHHPTTSTYEFVAGHSAHHPAAVSAGAFTRNVNHTKNVTVNITVDGRSAKTDDHLVERIAAKFREQIAMHVS